MDGKGKILNLKFVSDGSDLEVSNVENWGDLGII